MPSESDYVDSVHEAGALKISHQSSSHRPNLLTLLTNCLIFYHAAPFIGTALLKLAATCRSFRHLIFHLYSREAFNRLDLTPWGTFVRSNGADWLAFNADRAGSSFLDRCFDGLRRMDIMRHVRILILDNHLLSITRLRDLTSDENNNIHTLSLLSLKDSGTFIFYTDLLRDVIAWGRPVKLKALYICSEPASRAVEPSERGTGGFNGALGPLGVTNAVGAQLGAVTDQAIADNDDEQRSTDKWYSGSGEILRTRDWPGLGALLEAFAGQIAFDAVLCRHDRERLRDARPYVATIALRGCQSCGSCPEGPARAGSSPEHHLPLLVPPPWRSCSVAVAQMPKAVTAGETMPAFIARCRTCLDGRWCESCNAWWCENCYTPPSKRACNQPFTIKIHNGLCIANCLMGDLMQNGGEGGMWG